MVRSKVALAVLIVATLGGCSNRAAPSVASQTPADSASPQPLLDYELTELRILPQNADLALRSVKPGHWTQAIQHAKANNSDFVGRFQAEVRDEALGPPAQLDYVRYCLTVERPAALSVKQPKWLATSLLVPSSRTKAWLVSELKSRSGSVEVAEAQALTLLRGHQYFLVVLSADADRYRRLERLDSVHGPDAEAPLDYYQVVAKPLDEPVPLPTSALYWTSIAYLVWDDVDPQLLTSEQKQALIDWLHWGGQLIVSGPKSLDQLRDKAFLGDHLPALPGKAVPITAQMLAPLSARWTLPVQGAPGQPLAPNTPWSGVSLDPQAGAQFLPETGNLVVERPVGRGRIVATAFRLTEHDLWSWPSFDGFLNACLLRRPARTFSAAPEAEGGGLVVKWADGNQNVDPALVTQVRYFSRDESPAPPAPSGRGRRWRGDDDALSSQLSQERLAAAGVASWNDFGGVADAARRTLRRAAGIVIPNSRFVVRLLLAYLVILVPLNWLVFWAIGRVEWAWIAAPLIALGGMVCVVRLAQLDIGFARSQTEIAMLETYGGHPRGHLTRYTALYTSLATDYTLRSDDQATVILPFAADAAARRLAGLEPDTVSLQTTPKVELTNMAVASNSTAIVHAEQMIDLGGPFELVSREGASRLANRTKYALRQAAVLRRTANGESQIAWIGDLPPGREADLDFLKLENAASVIPDWTFLTADIENSPSAPLDLDQLANIARAPSKLRAGETRLLAMVDAALPGMAVEPIPSQPPRGATIVIAHLEQPQADAPRPDRNSRYDIVAPGEELDTTEPTVNEPVPPDQPTSPAADAAPAS